MSAFQPAPSMGLPFEKELVVDLFAGGGGASTGISRAYREPDVAVNHNPIALAVHRANHPQTDHYVAGAPAGLRIIRTWQRLWNPSASSCQWPALCADLGITSNGVSASPPTPERQPSVNVCTW